MAGVPSRTTLPTWHGKAAWIAAAALVAVGGIQPLTAQTAPPTAAAGTASPGMRAVLYTNPSSTLAPPSALSLFGTSAAALAFALGARPFAHHAGECQVDRTFLALQAAGRFSSPHCLATAISPSSFVTARHCLSPTTGAPPVSHVEVDCLEGQPPSRMACRVAECEPAQAISGRCLNDIAICALAPEALGKCRPRMPAPMGVTTRASAMEASQLRILVLKSEVGGTPCVVEKDGTVRSPWPSSPAPPPVVWDHSDCGLVYANFEPISFVEKDSGGALMALDAIGSRSLVGVNIYNPTAWAHVVPLYRSGLLGGKRPSVSEYGKCRP